jgi:glycyl-tRNA synthetase
VGGREVVVEPALFKRERRTEKKTGEHFVPHVAEPSFGLDRIFFAVMDAAYARVQKEGEPYVILKLDPRVAPVTVSVFPLMAKDGLDKAAAKLQASLVSAGLSAEYDDTGMIGKRYARADEAGVPWCVTVDYESLTDHAATVRDRDTQLQERVPLAAIPSHLKARLAALGGAP